MKMQNLKPIRTSLLELAAAMIVALSGVSLAGAASITGVAYSSVVDTSPPTYDLSTAVGTLDWQIYGAPTTFSLTPSVNKSGGTSITMNTTPVLTGACTTDNATLRSASAFTWTGGTPTATGTAVNPRDNGLAYGNAATVAYNDDQESISFVPGDTLPHVIHLYGYLAQNLTATTVRFTASLNGTVNNVFTTPTPAVVGDFDYTVTFQADNASDALTVVLTFQKTGAGTALKYIGINAAAIATGISGASKLAIWKGPGSSSVWDIGTTANWVTNSVATTYNEAGGTYDSVQFDDTASSFNVVPAAIVSPSSMLVSNNVNNYAIGSGTFGIAGLGGLTKDGSKSLILSGANSYAGNTTITAGTLKLATANAIPGGTGKGNVSIAGTLDLNTFSESINGLSGAGTVDTVAGGTPVLTVGGNNQSSAFSGVIKNTSGTLALTKTGTGALALSGASTYTGNTIISGGTLTVSSASSGGGSYTNADGTTLGVTVAGTSSSLTMSSYGTGANCTNTFAFGALADDALPVINISGNLAMNGDVRVNVTGTTLTGGVTNVLIQYAGTRSGTGSFVLGTIPAGFTAQFLDDTANQKVWVVVTPNIDYWVGVTDNSPGVVTNWSVVSNWSPAAVPATGEIIAFGADTFTGSFQPTLDVFHTVGGIIMTNTGQDVAIGGGKPLSIGGYGIMKTNATDTHNFSIVTTAGTLTATATETWLNNSPGLVSVTTGGSLTMGTNTLTIDGTGNTFIGSKIIDTGIIVKKGSGTLTLTNANTFSGGVTLLAGQLNVNYGGNIPSSGIGVGPLTIAGGMIIDNTSGTDLQVVETNIQNWNADFTYAGSANSLQLGAGPVILGGSGTNRQVTVTANNLTVAGVISGPYSLTKAGNGTLIFGNVTNVYSGDTIINGGTVKCGGANSIPSGVGVGNVVINAGGTLDLSSKNPSINGLSGSGLLDSSGPNNNNISIGGNAQTSTFNGSIINSGTGAMTINKVGAGTLTLNGVNTYRGTTKIQSGTLALGVNASILNSPTIIVTGGTTLNVSAVSGGFTVASSQTLSGGTTTNSGSINGSVTVPSLGLLSPGNGLAFGDLTFSNNLTLAGTTLVKATLDGAGTNDLLVVAGNVGYGGVLEVTNAGVTPFTNGTVFHVFTAGTHSGNFSSVTVVPSITNAVAFDPATGNLTIGAVAAPSTPKINSVTLSGGNLILSGTNGTPNGTYTIVASTNVALARASWTPILTNTFNGSGYFSNSIPVTNTVPKDFFLLKQ